MMPIQPRPDYSRMKQRLLADLSAVRNVRDSKYAKKVLRRYKAEAKDLHVAIRRIREIPMYLDEVIINI